MNMDKVIAEASKLWIDTFWYAIKHEAPVESAVMSATLVSSGYLAHMLPVVRQSEP